MEPEKKGAMSVQEAGRRGGSRTKELYGGTGYYQKIGKKGGSTTFERHGPEFYSEIGTKGGQRVRELIAKVKEEEEANG